MLSSVSTSDTAKVQDEPTSVLEQKSKTSNNLAFPTLGVKLRALQDFVESNGSEDAFVKVTKVTERKKAFNNTVYNEQPMTTADVCDRFLKPLTIATQSSYCEYLQSNGSELVGKANVFISHAWKYYFLDVVRSLEHHFKDEAENVFIWFDLFSNNQHKAPNLPFEWWQGTFMNAIRNFGRVVMVLSPWNNPITFTRVWCLWEIYCAVETNSKFEVAMTPEQFNSFISDIVKDGGDFHKMLSNIDVKNSQCWIEQDKERIFEVVKSSVGFDAVNQVVSGKMRQWVISAIDESIHQSRITNWERTLAKIGLCYDLGHYDKGLNLCIHCEKDYADVQDDVRMARTYHQMGRLCQSQGDYPKALKSHEKSLEITLKTMGAEHPDVAKSYNNIGNVYQDQGDYPQALESHEKSLAIRLETLGAEHPNVASSYNNLGIVYFKQGDYSKAIESHEKSLTIYLKSLGPEHPNVANSYLCLGMVYQAQGDYSRSLESHEKSLAIKLKSLGSEHPYVASSYYNIGSVYDSNGDYHKALECHEKCLAIRAKVLGAGHSNTKKSQKAIKELTDKM